MAYSIVKACRLVSTAMKARGVAKFPILARARANQKKKSRLKLRHLVFQDANLVVK
jgi:hypothetical protein